MFKLDLEKRFRTRDQIANTSCIREKARELQKNMYFCFTDYTKELVDESERGECEN